MMQTPSETRSDRRKRLTHERLVNAGAQLLLDGGRQNVSSRSVADLADVAVGTFYNHFSSVEDAIDAAIAPLRQWADEHAHRILIADDYEDAISVWVADFLVRLEQDGREFSVAHAAKTPVLAGLEEGINERMRVRWGEMSDERGIAPGAAGPVMIRLMTICGDLYGGVSMSDATAAHLARVVHAANAGSPERLEQQVELTLAHRQRLRDAATSSATTVSSSQRPSAEQGP